MIRLKLMMTKSAQSERKHFNAKNLDSKTLRANNLRVRVLRRPGRKLIQAWRNWPPVSQGVALR
jgi:hypothetical protein